MQQQRNVIYGKTKKRVSISRAKTLTPEQLSYLLDLVAQGKHPERDTVLVWLSFGAALRVQEIAGVQWKRNIFDSSGNVGKYLHVTSDIGKRTKERYVEMPEYLREALRRLRAKRPYDKFVIHPLTDPYENSERAKELGSNRCSPNTLVQYFKRLFLDAGFVGCSSHSGRRTYITTAARVCNFFNTSLRDVQEMVGHASLETTAGYIEPSPQKGSLANGMYGKL